MRVLTVPSGKPAFSPSPDASRRKKTQLDQLALFLGQLLDRRTDGFGVELRYCDDIFECVLRRDHCRKLIFRPRRPSAKRVEGAIPSDPHDPRSEVSRAKKFGVAQIFMKTACVTSSALPGSESTRNRHAVDEAMITIVQSFKRGGITYPHAIMRRPSSPKLNGSEGSMDWMRLKAPPRVDVRRDTGEGGITALPEQERILVGEELLGLLSRRRMNPCPAS